MKRILNFGSLNTDYVYKVDHILQGGETIQSESRTVFPGGKGLNQSIALVRAGLSVCHAGLIGTDGEHLRDLLNQNGVDTSLIETRDMPGGHTVIQVSREAQNAILLFGGSNGAVDEAYADRVLAQFGAGDILLLQNEISALPYILEKAHARGMEIWLNPSPMNENVLKCNLSLVSVFVLNEVEGEQLTGTKIPTAILDKLLQKYPHAAAVLTLGRACPCVRYHRGRRYGHGLVHARYAGWAFAEKIADPRGKSRCHCGLAPRCRTVYSPICRSYERKELKI